MRIICKGRQLQDNVDIRAAKKLIVIGEQRGVKPIIKKKIEFRKIVNDLRRTLIDYMKRLIALVLGIFEVIVLFFRSLV